MRFLILICLSLATITISQIASASAQSLPLLKLKLADSTEQSIHIPADSSTAKGSQLNSAPKLTSNDAQLELPYRERLIKLGEKRLSKLSSDLAAAVVTGGSYVGVASDGDAVIAPSVEKSGLANASIAAKLRLRQYHSGVERSENIPDNSSYTRTRRLIVFLEGEMPEVTEFAGHKIVDSDSRLKAIVLSCEQDICSTLLLDLCENPKVRQIEPDYPIVLQSISMFDQNDPKLDEQYALRVIRHPCVLDSDRPQPVSQNTVTVAIIDSGIDLDHEDLALNLWRRPREHDGSPVLHGRNYLDASHPPDDAVADNHPVSTQSGRHHGTACAGIIGAVAENGRGGRGVASQVKLMSMKIADSFGQTPSSEWGFYSAKAILDAVDDGAQVVSMSFEFATSREPAVLVRAADYAGENDVVLVAAAGNVRTILPSGQPMPERDLAVAKRYPACLEHSFLISVVATEGDDIDLPVKLAPSSRYGSVHADIGAPGTHIFTTYPDGLYDYFHGTSAAAPHVAGAIALIRVHADYQNLSAVEVCNLLLQNCRQSSTLSGKCVTGGVLDLSFLASPIEEGRLAGSDTGAISTYDEELFIRRIRKAVLAGEPIRGILQEYRSNSRLSTQSAD